MLVSALLSVTCLAQAAITLEQAKTYIDSSMQSLAPLVEQSRLKNILMNVKVRKDIPYEQRDGVDQSRLSLDLYTKKGVTDNADIPLIVYIHGGGWLGGDKVLALFKPAEFVSAGYIFASANYPFRPKSSLLEMAQSVADAVGFLHKEASKFGADPHCIFLMGHSAGAHLVSVLGTNSIFLNNAGVPMKSICGVISLDTAAYDLPALASSSPFHKMVFDGLQSTWLDVSPMQQIPNNMAKTPFLVFFSEGRIQAATQIIPFVEQLKSVGYPAFIHEAMGRTHDELDKKIGTSADVSTRKIQDFLLEFSR